MTWKFGIPEERVSDIKEKIRKLLDEPGANTYAASSDEYMWTIKKAMDQSFVWQHHVVKTDIF